MPKRRPPRRGPPRCPQTAKVRYRDALAAKLALLDCARSPRGGREETRYYRCPFCGGYHLTSAPYRPRDPDAPPTP